MDREKLIQEIDRLIAILGTMDATTKEYQAVSDRCRELFDMLVKLDSSAQKILSEDKRLDLEEKKLSIEEMRVTLEKMKLQSQEKIEEAKLANENRKLDIEKERVVNDKDTAEKKIDLENYKVELEENENKERKHYTRWQAVWRLGEIGVETAAKTAGIMLCIAFTGKVQQFGILDKTLVGFIPKVKY